MEQVTTNLEIIVSEGGLDEDHGPCTVPGPPGPRLHRDRHATHDGWQDAARALRPDMLIVDVLFPKGDEVIQTMRFDRAREDTSVIVLGESSD